MTAAARIGLATTTVWLAMLPLASGTTFAQASPDEPAAIVVYPYVVADTANRTDTLIQLSNTSSDLVELRCLYEDFTPQCVGGQPGESCVPVAVTNVGDPEQFTCTGICLRADDPECVGGQPGELCVGDPISCSGVCTPRQTRLPFRLRATAKQPLAWHASSGLQQFPLENNRISDIPGVGNGPFVGTLRCVAVTGDDPDQPSSDNALVGQATIEHSVGTPLSALAYSDAAAYRAVGIKALASGVNGDEFLNLGGGNAEYEACPGYGLLDHFSDGATLTAGDTRSQVSTTLVMANCSATLSATSDTIAQFLVFNEFGQRLSASRTVHGQLVIPLSEIDTPQPKNSIWWYAVFGTLTARTRINAVPPGGGLHIVAIESHRDPNAPERVQSDAINAHYAGQRQEGDVLAFWPPRCAGDCSFNGNVSLDSLVRGVNMGLGNALTTACLDINSDSQVTIDEILSAVNAARGGCPAPVAPPPRIVTPVPTPTISAPVLDGPQITYFGVATADDRPLQPDSTDITGRPVFSRPFGQGMTLIIEARPGLSGRPVGRCLYSEDLCPVPDLQVLVSRPLGDGNPAVCEQGGRSGGIPAVPSLDFTPDPATVAAINDLSCRALVGTASDPLTRTPSGGFGMVTPVSTVQFSIPIAKAWAFPVGDTVVAALLRDVAGNIGLVQEMVVRVAE